MFVTFMTLTKFEHIPNRPCMLLNVYSTVPTHSVWEGYCSRRVS